MTQGHRSAIGGGRLTFAFLLAAWIILPCGSIGFAQAPITSSGLNTRVTSSPTHPSQYDITGGTRPGNGPNLFHSFGDFNVPTNNIANFLNDSGLPTTNVLGRVTGGNPSNIFGTIQTTGFGNANLFLMNPAGIVFGPQASLNVGGSVAFTTADYLKLADGARFNALPGPQDGSITSAPVAAYGFLGSNPGAITVQGSQLAVAPGETIALVGGNVAIQTSTAETPAQSAKLSAPSGHIQLASAASPGQILATTLDFSPDVHGQSTGLLGSIDVSQKALLDVSGEQGGSVSIRGGHFVLNDATINAKGVDAVHGDGGVVTLSASTLRLENGAIIQADSGHARSAGTITIEGPLGQGTAATNVIVDNATLSSTANGESGSSIPGAINISAHSLTLNNGTYITADTFGPAPAGNITFNVGSMLADGEGPIRLHVSPESLITNPIISETGVLIESTSRSPDTGAGPGGRITIQGLNGPASVAKDVRLNDTIVHARTFGGTATTVPSAISITADTLTLSDQVELYTTANGAAPAGNVDLNVNTLRSNVNADGSFLEGRPVLIGSPTEHPDSTAGPPGIVTISGPGPESTDPAKLVMLGNTEIDTFAVGGSSPKPAPIIITTNTASLNNRTILVTTSGAAAPAPAGDIILNVDTLRINVNPDGTPILHANRVFLNSPSGRLDSTAGDPGTVTISGLGPQLTDAAHLVDLYNAQMSTAVEGGTAALHPGTITITADTVSLRGRTEIFAFTTSPAPAGNLVLNVNTLRANVNPDGSLISDGQPRSLLASVGVGENPSSGRAGTINISGIAPDTTDPARLIALNNTEVSTAVFGGTAATNPASISMAADTITITNSRNIHTDTLGAAPAGQLVFSAKNVTIDQASKINSSTSGAGSGGTILITATDSVVLAGQSSITAASTGTGNAGNVTINAGSQFLSNNGSVTTEASQASGGNITLQATDSIRLINSQINTSVQGGPTTTGGNITIDPAVMTLQNSQILAQANQGQGGNINISAGTFLADQTSLVSASSQFGLSGAVNIQSPVSSLSGTLATLPQQPLQVQHLLSQRCAAQGSGHLSSLVVAGRDRLPVEPGGWMMSPMTLITDGGTSPAAQPFMTLPADRSSGSLPQYGLSSLTAACGS
jgi:filamentous hemagglutinin family protein